MTEEFVATSQVRIAAGPDANGSAEEAEHSAATWHRMLQTVKGIVEGS